jgi:Transglycosylase SLT domain
VALAAGGVTFAIVIALVVSSLSGSDSLPAIPLPGIGQSARAGDPFAYIPSRQPDFVARATAGSGYVLLTKSPGGVIATAARVAADRGLIDQVTAGSGIDPNIVEAIVFVESAGRPNVIAGSDPTAASGLTQILAQTGQSLLGMHIDLARSKAITSRIDAAYAQGRLGAIPALQRERARIDDRFNPRLALAATVRYLQLAERQLGRSDLAVVSYHMGIGNLQQVLSAYDGGQPVPYVQLFFDTAPDHHAAAYDLLSGFGDQSSLYYWRVLGAAQIMHLYRTDRPALERLAALETASDSASEVLHPPDRTAPFATPGALASAYVARTILPLPSNAGKLALSYDPGMGSLAKQVGAPASLYRGLRPAALDLLIELAARVRALSRVAAPMIVSSTVTDLHYQQVVGVIDPVGATGYSFQIARQYASRAQAVAFQATLDRLQALNVIAWAREAEVINITVASDASQVIVDGP